MELIFPASASCSRKLDHNSASVSLLDALLSINSVARLGVLGVRRGVPGTRSLPVLEVPGRARPACSRCSGSVIRESVCKCEEEFNDHSPSSQPRRAAIS